MKYSLYRKLISLCGLNGLTVTSHHCNFDVTMFDWSLVIGERKRSFGLDLPVMVLYRDSQYLCISGLSSLLSSPTLRLKDRPLSVFGPFSWTAKFHIDKWPSIFDLTETNHVLSPLYGQHIRSKYGVTVKSLDFRSYRWNHVTPCTFLYILCSGIP